MDTGNLEYKLTDFDTLLFTRDQEIYFSIKRDMSLTYHPRHLLHEAGILLCRVCIVGQRLLAM